MFSHGETKMLLRTRFSCISLVNLFVRMQRKRACAWEVVATTRPWTAKTGTKSTAATSAWRRTAGVHSFFTLFSNKRACVCVQFFFCFFTFPFLFQRDFPGVVFHQESGHGIVRLNATKTVQSPELTEWLSERERERVVWLLPTPAQLDSTVAHSGFTFTYLYGFSRSAVDLKAAQQDVGTCEWGGIAEKSGFFTAVLPQFLHQSPNPDPQSEDVKGKCEPLPTTSPSFWKTEQH